MHLHVTLLVHLHLTDNRHLLKGSTIYRYCCQHYHNLKNSMQVQHHLADPLGDLLVEIVHVNLLGIALPINGIISSQVLRPTWRGT